MKLNARRPLAGGAASGLAKLFKHDAAFRKTSHDLQFAAQGLDNPPQRGDLHVGLLLQLGKAGLFDVSPFPK
jgi:hypothetical protein